MKTELKLKAVEKKISDLESAGHMPGDDENVLFEKLVPLYNKQTKLRDQAYKEMEKKNARLMRRIKIQRMVTKILKAIFRA